jgi:hypothetical protein
VRIDGEAFALLVYAGFGFISEPCTISNLMPHARECLDPDQFILEQTIPLLYWHAVQSGKNLS